MHTIMISLGDLKLWRRRYFRYLSLQAGISDHSGYIRSQWSGTSLGVHQSLQTSIQTKKMH